MLWFSKIHCSWQQLKSERGSAINNELRFSKPMNQLHSAAEYKWRLTQRNTLETWLQYQAFKELNKVNPITNTITKRWNAFPEHRSVSQ